MTDAELAVAATEAGAAVVRTRYGSSLARYDKSPTDFATDADIESERAIVNVLRAARPTDGIISEEAGAAGPAGAQRTWLVDPLCGTLNYAAQTPLVVACLSYGLGAAGPLLLAHFLPLRERVASTLVVVLLALALTGWIAARLTGLPTIRLIRRNVILGAAAMAAAIVVGHAIHI